MYPSLRDTSHPTMGAWIEIQAYGQLSKESPGRTPRWVRGLKYIKMTNEEKAELSHPTMGAWIEIVFTLSFMSPSSCRTPRWVRGLKSEHMNNMLHRKDVAPHDGCVD